MSDLTIYHLLRECLVRLDGAGQTALATHGLSLVHYDAIRCLAEQDGQRTGMLRRRLLIDHSKMTRVADGLVAAGLIERRQDPADRRAWRLYLTPAGQQLLTEAAASHDAFLAAQFAIFSPNDQQQLTDLLGRLNQALATAASA